MLAIRGIFGRNPLLADVGRSDWFSAPCCRRDGAGAGGSIDELVEIVGEVPVRLGSCLRVDVARGQSFMLA